MRHPDLDEMIQMERRRAELAEAAQFRLFAEAERAQPSQSAQTRPSWAGKLSQALTIWLARGLSYLGGRMVAWSCRLQTHYESLSGVHNPARPCS